MKANTGRMLNITYHMLRKSYDALQMSGMQLTVLLGIASHSGMKLMGGAIGVYIFYTYSRSKSINFVSRKSTTDGFLVIADKICKGAMTTWNKRHGQNDNFADYSQALVDLRFIRTLSVRDISL